MPEALFAIWRDYARGGICWRESPPAAEALSGWKKNFVNVSLPEDLPEDKMDNRILRVCLGLSEAGTDPVVLVTKDILLRVKAQMLGISGGGFCYGAGFRTGTAVPRQG